MQRVIQRQPWICVRCLCKQQLLGARRSQSTAAAAISGTSLDCLPVQHTPPDAVQDDQVLRKIFDSKPFWRDFAQKNSAARRNAGLIGNAHLATPEGFHSFAEDALARCRRIVDKTLAASTVEEYKCIARDLDRLSDLLCRVIDLSDFVRGTHPDPKFAEAATQAFSLMFQYMNVLNTTTGLNAQLQKALSIPEVTSSWTEEEKVVAQILMKDFAKSGIDLPTKQREAFVNLSNDISQAGTDFVNGMEPANDQISLSPSQMKGVDPRIVKNLTSWNKVIVPVYSPEGRLVMTTAHDEEARRRLYLADRTASRASVDRLEKLLLKRAELAQLTGYKSFAEMALVDKMAKSPEAVVNFLKSLNINNKGQLQQEVDRLLAVKRASDPYTSSLQPWDHSYYLHQLQIARPFQAYRTSKSRFHDTLPSFLSLGNVISGLSRLFSSLYGVRLVPRSPAPGEVWSSDVRRLDVVSETEAHIAIIYCDLFSRGGKPPNPAHFTLVCSREISKEEIDHASGTGGLLNDGMPIGVSLNNMTGDQKLHQLPTIALVCDFPENSSSQPTLLSLHSLTTLFHEMGHAVHSVLGRTTMQGIAGTRCATDFAELPSVLMEYFATDPTVLKLFARHWQTDAPPPDDMIEALRKEQRGKAERSGGWENENQILMALLDQVYHSYDVVEAYNKGTIDSSALYHRIWSEYGSVPEPEETTWQGFFGHLYGYGATYYSYLFDRAIARQVWRAVFRDGRDRGGIDRNAGERLKENVLRWGGGRDPWLCLEDLMGEGKGVLAEGGEKAMLEVGKWGVGASADGAM